MTIKLHVFPLSPRAFKVLFAAHHLGIARGDLSRERTFARKRDLLGEAKDIVVRLIQAQ